MSDLQRWMNKNGWDDARLAKYLRLDRSQASRIRRGKSGTNRRAAQKIERLTGLPWHGFIEPAQTRITRHQLRPDLYPEDAA